MNSKKFIPVKRCEECNRPLSRPREKQIYCSACNQRIQKKEWNQRPEVKARQRELYRKKRNISKEKWRIKQ